MRSDHLAKHQKRHMKTPSNSTPSSSWLATSQSSSTMYIRDVQLGNIASLVKLNIRWALKDTSLSRLDQREERGDAECCSLTIVCGCDYVHLFSFFFFLFVKHEHLFLLHVHTHSSALSSIHALQLSVSLSHSLSLFCLSFVLHDSHHHHYQTR